MASQWWFVLFFALIALKTEAAPQIPIPARFGGLTCIQRVCHAARNPWAAVRDNRVAAYIDRSLSLWEVGKRLEALSKGWFRNQYPDLPLVAAFVQNFESAKLGKESAAIVGIRYPVLSLIDRPLASWEIAEFTYGDPTISDLIEYTIKHVDGSTSKLFAFREGDRHPTAPRDYRPVSTVIAFSNGPEKPATYVGYRTGKQTTISLEVQELDPRAFLEKVAERKMQGKWVPRISTMGLPGEPSTTPETNGESSGEIPAGVPVSEAASE